MLLQTRHNNAREYRCEECPSSYSYHGNLVAHVAKRHPQKAAAKALKKAEVTKADVTRAKEGTKRLGKVAENSMNFINEDPGKVVENMGRSGLIKLRVPSKERGNGSR